MVIAAKQRKVAADGQSAPRNLVQNIANAVHDELFHSVYLRLRDPVTKYMVYQRIEFLRGKDRVYQVEILVVIDSDNLRMVEQSI